MSRFPTIAALLVAIPLAVTAAPPNDARSAKEQLIYAFCYAEQAGQLCDDLKLLLGTKAEFERRNEVSVKGPVCLQGLDQAIADETAQGRPALCAQARRRYGCGGTEMPRLLSNWPSGPRCDY